MACARGSGTVSDGAHSSLEQGGSQGHERVGSGRRSLRIGLTGPIGCGKSTVAGWLAELGAHVIDADQVAREVTVPGSSELDEVVAVFGTPILSPDGTLDRQGLGQLVFDDPRALAHLESIIHPAVRVRILNRISAAERDGAVAIVVEAIKLVEGGLAALCDEVWLVTCSADAQRARIAARAAARGTAVADEEARIAAQAGLAERLAPSATRILDTSGTLAEGRRAVEEAWTEAMGRR